MIDWSSPAAEASTRRLLYEVPGGFFAVLPPIMLLIEEHTVVWPWIGYGGSSIVVGYTVSRTAVGRRVETWFTQIGPGGRFVCIVFAAICIWGGIWTFEPHIPSLANFVFGAAISLLGVSVVRLCNRLRSAAGRS